MVLTHFLLGLSACVAPPPPSFSSCPTLCMELVALGGSSCFAVTPSWWWRGTEEDEGGERGDEEEGKDSGERPGGKGDSREGRCNYLHSWIHSGWTCNMISVYLNQRNASHPWELIKSLAWKVGYTTTHIHHKQLRLLSHLYKLSTQYTRPTCPDNTTANLPCQHSSLATEERCPETCPTPPVATQDSVTLLLQPLHLQPKPHHP